MDYPGRQSWIRGGPESMTGLQKETELTFRKKWDMSVKKTDDLIKKLEESLFYVMM